MIEPNHQRPLLMGILNVTPDSFSDGGEHLLAEQAVAHGLAMVEQGADLVDVGGESTRPAAMPVDAEKELRRVLPVVTALASQGVTVSIDTMKATVAQACVEAGAKMVNDVSALSDPDMAGVAVAAGVSVCLVHRRGDAQTMHTFAEYNNAVREALAEINERVDYALKAGIDRKSIWIDPGIGFAKTAQQNLEILKGLGDFVASRYPVVVGVSRKSFIGAALGGANPLPPSDRLEGTLAAQVLAQIRGAAMIRAHDVAAARRAIDMTAAIMTS